MKRLTCALTALSSFLCLPAFAGSWSSGGGEILEHAQNPWFVDIGQPTKPITYCVAVGDDFPIGLSTLENLVDQSFDWWTNQFSNAHFPVNSVWLPGGGEKKVVVGINTKGLKKETCNENVDLAFQFGFLTQDQIDEFKRLNVDLRRYVALTIRTDYSNELRGKGFIYVSPDRGPNSFVGHNILPNAWTEDDSSFYRLRGVINHEMGHVFGLKHGATNDTIMSAKFAEDTVSKTSLITSSNPMNQAVFFPKGDKLNDTFCKEENLKLQDIRKFFEIPDTTECFRIYLDLNQLVVSTGYKESGQSWKIIGRAKFDNRAERYHQLVSLWLPPEQTLFKIVWPSALLGAASAEVMQSATFVNEVTGKKSPLFIQATPRFVQIGGVVDGRMVPDLLPKGEYSSLSGWEQK